MKVEPNLENIKLFLSDVDGVMTDTRIFLGAHGTWTRQFSVYDGIGLKRLQERGVQVGIITAAKAEDIRKRFEFLKIDFFYEGAKNKVDHLNEIIEETGLLLNDIAYIGDDLMDLPVIERVGFGVTVPHALKNIKDKASYTTINPGGFGAVREVCEMIISNKEGGL